MVSRGRCLLAASVVALVVVGRTGPARPNRTARPFCTAVAGVQGAIRRVELAVSPRQAARIVAALTRAMPEAPNQQLKSAVTAIAHFYRGLENGRLPAPSAVVAVTKPIDTFGAQMNKLCGAAPVSPS
jgi:hypothetical protein